MGGGAAGGGKLEQRLESAGCGVKESEMEGKMQKGRTDFFMN